MKRQTRVALALLLAAGVALTGCTKTGDPSGSASASPAASDAPDAPGDVAVLVVDDFGLGKKEQVAKGSTDNCTIATTDVGSNGAGDGELPPGYSHGEAVYSVLKQSLSAANPSGTPTIINQTTRPRPVVVAPAPATIEMTTEWKYPYKGGSQRVILAAAHAYEYRTDAVLTSLATAIEDLQRRERINRFVINLSFVVIPCDTVKFLEKANFDELLVTYNLMLKNSQDSKDLKAGLSGYLTPDQSALDPGKVTDGGFTLRLLQDNRLAPMRPYLVSAYYRQIDLDQFGGKDPQEIKDQDLRRIYNDPGWKNFRDNWILPGAAASPAPSKPRVIPVGAAGNGLKLRNPKEPDKPIRVSLPFPFAPALWDFVASASADPPPGGAVNSGEAKLGGSGPSFAPASFGTSYAAPRLSALEARYLLETGRVICDGQKPPLGYVDMTRDTPINVATNSPWQNKAKADWPPKCHDFPIP